MAQTDPEITPSSVAAAPEHVPVEGLAAVGALSTRLATTDTDTQLRTLGPLSIQIRTPTVIWPLSAIRGDSERLTDALTTL